MEDLDRQIIGATTGQHLCLFYSHEPLLLDAITSFAVAGLQRGEPLRLMVTKERLVELERCLEARGFSPNALRKSGMMAEFDARAATELLLGWGDAFDADELRRIATELLGPVRDDGRPLRAYGDVAGMLAAQGAFETAARLEQVWSALQLERPLMVFCGYARTAFRGALRSTEMPRTSALHTHALGL